MEKPKKTKPISKEKNAASSATSRQGRIPLAQTIKIFEGYSYLKEGVTLTNKIFEYIENTYIKNNVAREKNQYDHMIQRILQLKNAAQKEALDGQKTKKEELFASKSSFYNLLDYFLQSLNQLPKEEKGNEIEVGKKEWNQYLAKNDLRIPSNIMDMIVEKEFSNIQVFALMILQLYSMSNEDMAIDIILIFKACFESSTIVQPNVELIKIIQQYITYFLEKISFLENNEKDLAKNQTDPSSSLEEDTLHGYRQSLKNLLAYLSQFLMEQLPSQ